MMDRASWEFTDLRSRMNMLESREELDANDILRPHVLARIVTSSWLARAARLRRLARCCSRCCTRSSSLFAEEAYHETNRFLLQRHVLPEVDLRPFIRRSQPRRPAAAAGRARGGFGTPTGMSPSGAVRVPAVGDAAERGRARSARRRG